jgi:hypothetical protein
LGLAEAAVRNRLEILVSSKGMALAMIMAVPFADNG